LDIAMTSERDRAADQAAIIRCILGYLPRPPVEESATSEARRLADVDTGAWRPLARQSPRTPNSISLDHGKRAAAGSITVEFVTPFGRIQMDIRRVGSLLLLRSSKPIPGDIRVDVFAAAGTKSVTTSGTELAVGIKIATPFGPGNAFDLKITSVTTK
jgi:hypothetical protein